MSDIRVLIVEDDPFVAMDIEAAVVEQFGQAAELIVVDSVTQARQVTAARLSCALLDIDVVDGQTFEIAASLLKKGTPFAFVSGSTPGDVPEHLRTVRFLRKPFSTREIARFVSDVVAVSDNGWRPTAP
ncbi:MAG: response regulator [Hyphomicrobiales bacterium]|nr:MAG: response regulator [Hyphomicrobiales bacterium]